MQEVFDDIRKSKQKQKIPDKKIYKLVIDGVSTDLATVPNGAEFFDRSSSRVSSNIWLQVFSYEKILYSKDEGKKWIKLPVDGVKQVMGRYFPDGKEDLPMVLLKM